MELSPVLPDSPDAVLQIAESLLSEQGFRIIDRSVDRPWGGFLVIDPAQAQQFASVFFQEVDFSTIQLTGHLSPKILMVKPHHRLSWQYHHRRAEIWKHIGGTAAIITSPDDQEGHPRTLHLGEVIRLAQGERHRLIGGSGWGMIAEIWQHTNSSHLSDEADIVRLQDDYRKI